MGKIQKQGVGKRSLAWFMNEISVLKPCLTIYKLSNICVCGFSLYFFQTHVCRSCFTVTDIINNRFILPMKSFDQEFRAFGKH